MSPEDRFWSRVEIKSADECWEWTGALNSAGYGRLAVGGKDTRAHRFSYELAHGPIPEDRPFICHKCGNRKCVNPHHLYAGTGWTNARDRVQMGRQFHAYGLKNGKAKLSDAQVEQIRRLAHRNLRFSGVPDYAGIAERFNVTANHVGAIVRGERRNGLVRGRNHQL